MLSGFNYSNDSNYNITNSNPNYIIQHNQNNLNSMYRNSSNFSNSTTNSNKNKFVYYDNDQQTGNIMKKKNVKNKTVKFNEKVSVIKVESYKEYNKIEDEINIDNILNNNNNYKPNRDKNNKKGDSCECKIV